MSDFFFNSQNNSLNELPTINRKLPALKAMPKNLDLSGDLGDSADIDWLFDDQTNSSDALYG